MCRNNNVCILPVVISVILGIVIGALVFGGTIATGILAVPIIIALIFSAITLILLFVATAFSTRKETKECLCEYGGCLALGAFVTLVFGFLAITFIASLVAASIVSALLIGFLGFGIILNLSSFVGLLVCLIRTNCSRSRQNCIYENDYDK